MAAGPIRKQSLTFHKPEMEGAKPQTQSSGFHL